MSEDRIATFLEAVFDPDGAKEAAALFDAMTERERQTARDIFSKKAVTMRREEVERIASFAVERK